MYGLVNKGIYDLVVKNHGHDTWDVIAEKAGVEEALFINMKSYDDSVTYKLVAAASEVLNVSAEDILIGFGKYWISYTAKMGYGNLLEMGGRTFPEFINNLNNLHSRVGQTYRGLKPPSFSCSEISSNTILVQYHSERAGLAPLVVGLLHGLGDLFKVSVVVDQTQHKEQSGHDEFKVVYTPL